MSGSRVCLLSVSLCSRCARGCSGVFDSDHAGAAVLSSCGCRRAAAAAPASTTGGSVLLQRPEAGPGLDSERIALLRSDQRFDFYAASRWAAPAPDLIESVIARCVARHRRIHARCSTTLRRSRRVTACAARCGVSRRTTRPAAAAPTVHVALDCTLGRHRDRELLASFTAQGSAVLPSDDRLTAVVAAFESGDRGGRWTELGARRRRVWPASPRSASEKPPSEGR